MTNILTRFSALGLILSMVCVSQMGCVPFPVLLGGAFLGGAMVATDRRTSGAQLEDEGIELRAASRLRAELGERAHINVTSYNRQVLLTGEAPTAADKATAQALASQVENVKSVYNEIGVLGNSSLSARSSDTLVTGRAKAAIVDDKELSANAFKLVTERGTVYMMGRVTAAEANRATERIRAVPGVQKIVRLLETISEEELRRMQPKPAPAAAPDKPTPILSGSGTQWNSGSGQK